MEVEEKSGMSEWIELQRHQRYSLEHSSRSSSTGFGRERRGRKSVKKNPLLQLLTPKPWPRIICISCKAAIQFICSASILLTVAAGIYLLVLENLALLTGTCRTIIVDGISGRSHAYTSAVGLVYLFGVKP